MKFFVTQEKLNKALAHTSRISSARNTLPILANVLIRAEKNKIEIISTNLEQAIKESLAGKIESPGEVTVPARLLSEFVSNLPAGENIEINQENSQINIAAGKFTATVNGTPTDEFPSLPEVTGEKTVKISAKDLKNALQKTNFAASRDDARQILTGALFEFGGKTLAIAATDSYRLAETKTKLGESGADARVVVPASSLNELLRIIDEGEEEVELIIDGAQVQFNYQNTQLITKTISGEYPKYQQLIPQQSEVVVQTKRQDLLDITKVASLFARENAGGIKIEASETDQEVKINSIASQVGENTSAASAKVTGTAEVTLNSRYVIDALNSFSDEEIVFRFSGKLSPCVVEPVKNPKNQLHVIMPLKS